MTPEELATELLRVGQELERIEGEHRLECAKAEGRVARLAYVLGQQLQAVRARLEALARTP